MNSHWVSHLLVFCLVGLLVVVGGVRLRPFEEEGAAQRAGMLPNAEDAKTGGGVEVQKDARFEATGRDAPVGGEST